MAMPAAVPRSRTKRADEIADGDEGGAEQDRGADHRGEGRQLSAIDRRSGRGERRRRGAVAEDGGEGEDGEMADELAEHDLPARDRIAEQQQHGAALDLADDGVVRDQERDQRQEEDGEAREADDHHVERAHADAAGRRAAEEGERQRERARAAASWRATQRLRKPSRISLPATRGRCSSGAPPGAQEMGVELVQRRRQDIEVLDRQRRPSRAPQHLDLVLRRRHRSRPCAR